MLHIKLANEFSIKKKHREFILNFLKDKISDKGKFNSYIKYDNSKLKNLITNIYNVYLSKMSTGNECSEYSKVISSLLYNLGYSDELKNVTLQVINKYVDSFNLAKEIENLRIILDEEYNKLSNEEENIFTSLPEYHKTFLKNLEIRCKLYTSIINAESFAALYSIKSKSNLNQLLIKLLGYVNFTVIRNYPNRK